MSVNRAYISSLWTSGLLVASSLLVLALTSAIVTFNGWPGDLGNAPVDRVTVGSPAAAVVEPPRASAKGSTKRSASKRSAPAATVRGPAEPPSGGTSRSPRVTSSPGYTTSTTTGTGTAAKQPSRQGPSTEKPEPRRGDPIRNLGDAVAGQVDPVSPDAGGATRSTADSGAAAVDSLPALR